MTKLDIIIPVYNEDENIIQLLKSLEKEIKYNFRILICYDSEEDKTLKYFKEAEGTWYTPSDWQKKERN